MDCEIWSELITKIISGLYSLFQRHTEESSILPLISAGFTRVCAIFAWLALTSQNCHARSSPEVWLSVTICVSDPTCRFFCAAHSSMSQFWTLTWHSWGYKKWVWGFCTLYIYFRLNTWSFPWKVDIDKLISGCGRAREQLAMNNRMCCGKCLLSKANSHCKQPSHTVKCH